MTTKPHHSESSKTESYPMNPYFGSNTTPRTINTMPHPEWDQQGSFYFSQNSILGGVWVGQTLYCQQPQRIKRLFLSGPRPDRHAIWPNLSAQDCTVPCNTSVSRQFLPPGRKKPYRYPIRNSKWGLWLGSFLHTNKPIGVPVVGGARHSGNRPVAVEIAWSSR